MTRRELLKLGAVAALAPKPVLDQVPVPVPPTVQWLEITVKGSRVFVPIF